MYFKKIELFGFKSFASKTELIFEPGVTAIVGPNGCGKSNIADAIKWVLGEQSAKELRGNRMEDVIFNGTDDTEPVNLAEVSLTLSNENRILPLDYDEVTITRKIYRSGESEYFLNKTLVRLKDVSELLMGTGIGTSAYSLMEQGRIDMILSAKPEERRYIFEEASGITKYKSKKKEALRKLEQTENNLLRINDIINEVKRQISSVERQANKAQKYKEIFEKLKTLDINHSLYESKTLKEKIDSYKNEAERIKTEETSLTADLDSLSKSLQELRNSWSDIENNISEVKTALAGVENSIDKNESKKVLNAERIDELTKRIASLEQETANLKTRISNLNEQVENMRAQVSLFAQEESKKVSLLGEKENSLLHISNLLNQNDETITKCKLDIVEVMSIQSRIRNDLAKISANIQNLSTRLRRLSIEKENTTEELTEADTQLSAVDLRVKQLLDKTEGLSSQKSQIDGSLKNLQQELSGIDERYKDVIEKITTSQSKLEFLEDLKTRHEGFSEGAKSILNKLNEFGGIYGVLADLVDVKKGFDACVEAALSGNAQAILAKDKTAAKAALDYLSREDKGRATFIILEDLKEQASSEKNNFSNTKGILGSLADFVKIDSKYRIVLHNLLKDTYVVDNLDTALELAKKMPDNIKLVTKTAQIVSYGTVSGGSIPKDETTSIIGRDKKIKEFKTQLSELKTQKDAFLDSKTRLMNEIDTQNNELDKINASLQREEINLTNSQNQKEKLTTEKQKLLDEVSLLDIEIEEALSEENQLKERELNLKRQLEDAQQKDANLQNQITTSQQVISAKAKEKESTIIEITQLKTELALLSDKKKSQEQTFRMQEESLNEQLEIFDTRAKELKEAAIKIGELKKEIENLSGQNRRLAKEKEHLNLQIKEIASKKTNMTNLILEAETLFKDKQERLNDIRKDLSETHMGLTDLSYKQTGLKDRILQNYKVDIDQIADSEGSFQQDWDAVKEQIAQLKEKLEQMGAVNLVAIEEHQELQDRHAFLTTQQQDLLNAKDSLHKAIIKINKTTKTLFWETFEKVQATFKEFFRLLFGGGRAELILLDEADILESGIEIVVQPPGKKLQSIMLLSGGERALTAIALLFAIFKVKPSPFCLLDEIDAPLDESNIDRFSKVLQDFVKTSQFIIITHNKKTITMADVMYGITMEKSGISKIVSVKFAKDEGKEKETNGALQLEGQPA